MEICIFIQLATLSFVIWQQIKQQRWWKHLIDKKCFLTRGDIPLIKNSPKQIIQIKYWKIFFTTVQAAFFIYPKPTCQFIPRPCHNQGSGIKIQPHDPPNHPSLIRPHPYRKQRPHRNLHGGTVLCSLHEKQQARVQTLNTLKDLFIYFLTCVRYSRSLDTLIFWAGRGRRGRWSLSDARRAAHHIREAAFLWGRTLLYLWRLVTVKDSLEVGIFILFF